MKATFDPMDVLFYAMGRYYGYRYSIHRVNEEELANIIRSA